MIFSLMAKMGICKKIKNKMENKVIKISEFKNLKFEYIKNKYVATLIDNQGFEILKGYGVSITKAINDLHHNLIWKWIKI